MFGCSVDFMNVSFPHAYLTQVDEEILHGFPGPSTHFKVRLNESWSFLNNLLLGFSTVHFLEGRRLEFHAFQSFLGVKFVAHFDQV